MRSQATHLLQLTLKLEEERGLVRLHVVAARRVRVREDRWLL